MKCKEFILSGLPNDSLEGTVKYKLDLVSAGGQMGGQWHRTSGIIHIFLRKGE
jgi:hypothetical protein